LYRGEALEKGVVFVARVDKITFVFGVIDPEYRHKRSDIFKVPGGGAFSDWRFLLDSRCSVGIGGVGLDVTTFSRQASVEFLESELERKRMLRDCLTYAIPDETNEWFGVG
jgi:hypothetical protein